MGPCGTPFSALSSLEVGKGGLSRVLPQTLRGECPRPLHLLCAGYAVKCWKSGRQGLEVPALVEQIVLWGKAHVDYVVTSTPDDPRAWQGPGRRSARHTEGL